MSRISLLVLSLLSLSYSLTHSLISHSLTYPSPPSPHTQLLLLTKTPGFNFERFCLSLSDLETRRQISVVRQSESSSLDSRIFKLVLITLNTANQLRLRDFWMESNQNRFKSFPGCVILFFGRCSSFSPHHVFATHTRSLHSLFLSLFALVEGYPLISVNKH